MIWNPWKETRKWKERAVAAETELARNILDRNIRDNLFAKIKSILANNDAVLVEGGSVVQKLTPWPVDRQDIVLPGPVLTSDNNEVDLILSLKRADEDGPIMIGRFTLEPGYRVIGVKGTGKWRPYVPQQR